MKNTNSLLILTRTSFSLLAAFFIVLHGRWDLIGQALVSPAFYVAVLVSFIIAYLLLSIVHSGNAFLNRRFPWSLQFYKRMLLQLTLCVILPASIDILLAGTFIKATGRDFWESGFFNFDFPLVLAFILILNMFYFSFFRDMKKQETPIEHTNENLISVQRGVNKFELIDTEDIFCIIKEGKQISIVLHDGKEITIKDTLNSLENRLQHSNLIRINRSTIIAIESIARIDFGIKRNTYDITLNFPYNTMIGADRNGFFVVTGDHMPTIGMHFQPN